MRSAADFHVFDKWKHATVHAFGSKTKPSLVPDEDKAAYTRIFEELTTSARAAVAASPHDHALTLRTMNYSPKHGSRGHRPVDLWASLIGARSEKFSDMPQIYAIASERGLEVGFSASIDEADYHDPSVKARNRLIIPLINGKLPAPDSAQVQRLQTALAEQGGWSLNRKTRLVPGDEGHDAFTSVSAMIRSLKGGSASQGGTICRVFSHEDLEQVDLTSQFKLAVENFAPLIEACAPTSWDRQIVLDEKTVAEIEPPAPFDPDQQQDDRKRILAEVARRQGQGKFRSDLFKAYDGRCAISETGVASVLQAAHITPYLGPQTNAVSNGLLLRADIHTLFDLKLIKVDPKTMKVVVSSALAFTPYADLRDRPLRVPKLKAQHPSQLALTRHYESAA